MKILVGMSGGIDSSFAALKLMEEGHQVAGAVILMHEHTDLSSARSAAAKLGIPLYEIDGRDLFAINVKANFVDEYREGRTPNPCIICNREVKFRILCDFARENGFDKIATGHYAKIVEITDNGEKRFAFAESLDEGKDQTYMLYRLGQDILSMLVLPLYDEVKTNVTARVIEEGIVPENIGESQEICFIPDNNYVGYIEKTLGSFAEGNFIDEQGNILGKHKGIIHYTVGQRKGLGIALGYRAFVSRIDKDNNTITLSQEATPTKRVEVNKLIYSGMSEPKTSITKEVLVKLRYRAKKVKAIAHFHSDDTCSLELLEDFGLVAPGQSAVLYSDGMVIAGGFIC